MYASMSSPLPEMDLSFSIKPLTFTPYRPCGLPDCTLVNTFLQIRLDWCFPDLPNTPQDAYTPVQLHISMRSNLSYDHSALARPNFPRALKFFVDVIVLPAVERLLHKMDAFRRNHSFSEQPLT